MTTRDDNHGNLSLYYVNSSWSGKLFLKAMTTILTEGLPCFKEIRTEKWCQNKCSLNILLQGSEISCYGKCQ